MGLRNGECIEKPTYKFQEVIGVPYNLPTPISMCFFFFFQGRGWGGGGGEMAVDNNYQVKCWLLLELPVYRPH